MSDQSRQLAAIMFTDIEGYTALMQADEEQAIKFRERHRLIFESVTAKHQGRILQYYGDGTLSIFDSAIDAVLCAVEMQREFQTEPVIPVRIGIHTGDIVFSEDEIIGDGVNVASRIESLATAGSVFISDKVYDDIKNQKSIQTKAVGSFVLKNVKKPVDVYALTNDGLIVPSLSQIKGKTKSSYLTKAAPTLTVLGLLVLILGIAGFFIYQRNSSEYRETGAQIADLCQNIGPSDVEQQVTGGRNEMAIAFLRTVDLCSMDDFRQTGYGTNGHGSLSRNHIPGPRNHREQSRRRQLGDPGSGQKGCLGAGQFWNLRVRVRPSRRVFAAAYAATEQPQLPNNK